MGVTRNKIPPHLHERYGIRPRPWKLIGAAAAVALSLAGYLLSSIGGNIASGGEVTLLVWAKTADDAVGISWSVNRADNASVTCVLRVQDSDRFDVGYAVVRVKDTAATPQFRTVIATRGQIYAVPTPVCEPVEANNSNIPGSHFRPGLLPPAQSGNLAAPWQPLPAWLEPLS